MDTYNRQPLTTTMGALGQPPSAMAPAGLRTSAAVPGPIPTRGPATLEATAQTRTTRLRLVRVDPWSVLTLSTVLAGVLALIWVGACALLYVAVDHMGAVAAVNDVYHTLIKPTVTPAAGPAPVGPVTLGRTLMVAGVTGLIGVMAASTLATLSAVAYNASARLTTGVSVTVTEQH